MKLSLLHLAIMPILLYEGAAKSEKVKPSALRTTIHVLLRKVVRRYWELCPLLTAPPHSLEPEDGKRRTRGGGCPHFFRWEGGGGRKGGRQNC
jgi:hypothetical protein